MSATSSYDQPVLLVTLVRRTVEDPYTTPEGGTFPHKQ